MFNGVIPVPSRRTPAPSAVETLTKAEDPEKLLQELREA